MNTQILSSGLGSARFYFVGIKGTGMTALAELLHLRGAEIQGSDCPEVFYTDGILQKRGIVYFEEIDPRRIDRSIDMLIYSSAYNPEEHPEIVAAERQGIPCLSYTEALGAISKTLPFAGISGVHGKTTTTAMAGSIAAAVELESFTLAGSAVPSFGGSSVDYRGEECFIAETCEYRRHFLHFHPDWLLITTVEEDHLDYFKDYDDILSAFVEFGLRLSPGGCLVYCADDPGAREAAVGIAEQREDIRLVPYGFSACGEYRIEERRVEEEAHRFRMSFHPEPLFLKIPGSHAVLDAAGAVALLREIAGPMNFDGKVEAVREALASFCGSKRRSEILYNKHDILIMDDYGHHPTEIRTTLAGLREFYPRRRIIVDFMSHTYSRTEALFDQFCQAFGDADLLILHKIYASAREKLGTIDGESLYRAVAKNHSAVSYTHEPMDAFEQVKSLLKAGDLFISLGAGNNWILSRALADYLEEERTEDE